MDLNEVLVFARVVQAGSFVGAARQLDMPKSTVSRKVVDLEARLGARLLQRTTRSLRLTDAGRAYYAHAERILAELEQAEAVVGRLQAEPRGPLRLSGVRIRSGSVICDSVAGPFAQFRPREPGWYGLPSTLRIEWSALST